MGDPKLCFKFSKSYVCRQIKTCGLYPFDINNAPRYYPTMKVLEKLPIIHPGEILLEEFLKPLHLTQYRLSKDIQVPPRRVNEIVHGLRAISADTALRFARYFGNSPEFWIHLQATYDLELQKELLGERLVNEVKILTTA